MQKTLILNMGRMNCGGCAKNITRVIQALPGVTEIATDVSIKTVTVQYHEEQVTVEDITTALAEARYPVASVEETSSTRVMAFNDLTVRYEQ